MFGLGTFWDEHLSWDSWQEVLGWYPWHTHYPVHLRREFDDRRFTVKESDAQPIEPRQYARLLRSVQDYARASVSRRKLAYHNENHFADMARSATMLFDRMYGSAARRGPLIAIRQGIEIAAWLHDCHHSGCTLRADSIQPLYKPELGTNVSAEFVSATAADELLRHAGLPIQWRAFVVNLILSTTFAGGVAKQRGIQGIPAIEKPRTAYFALMRLADVWPPSDVYIGAQQGINVNLHEIPATGVITDPVALIQAQIGFEQYRQGEMRWFDQVCGKSLTKDGQATSRRLQQQYERALSGKDKKLLDFVTQCMS
ncbi:MAG TPA: hypothetical protein VJ841_01150 [Candidatus Saccharimonadales bacterium]|nr:hypothetical protein [Candidatus Saccharimonadales bacterium]